jgi:hypothetical protein
MSMNMSIETLTYLTTLHIFQCMNENSTCYNTNKASQIFLLQRFTWDKARQLVLNPQHGQKEESDEPMASEFNFGIHVL